MLTPKQERLLLFLLVAIQFSNIVDFMIMMPLGPQLMRIFSITPKQFSFLVASYTFTAAISGFFSAFLIDRFDRKAVLLFFYLGFGLGTIACAMAPTYEWLLLARSLTGLFGGVLGSICNTVIGDVIPFERRGAAMGKMMIAFSSASVFGVPLSLILANQFGWHFPFMFLGVLSVLIWAATFNFVPSMRGHLYADKKHNTPVEIVSSVLNSPNQIFALMLMVFLVLGQFTVIPFLSPSLVANAGMTEKQLPLIYLIGGGFSIFTAPLIGRLADKYGKKKVGSYSIIISLIPLLSITHLGKSPLFLILPLAAFFFACVGGRMIPTMALVTATVHAQMRGSFMSFVSSFVQMASATASYIAGSIVVKNDSGQLLHYERVGYVAVVFSIVAVLILQKIKPVE